MKNFAEWINQPNTLFTEYLNTSLQEIYNYEILHGNVVESLSYYDYGSRYRINVYFKFPLRFDIDRFINQKEAVNEITRNTSYNTRFDAPFVSYLHEELRQSITGPMEYRTLQIREQVNQRSHALEINPFIAEVILPLLILLEAGFLSYLLSSYLVSSLFQNNSIVFLPLFILSLLILASLSLSFYKNIIYPKFFR
jgi:hypothetical protein